MIVAPSVASLGKEPYEFLPAGAIVRVGDDFYCKSINGWRKYDEVPAMYREEIVRELAARRRKHRVRRGDSEGA